MNIVRFETEILRIRYYSKQERPGKNLYMVEDPKARNLSCAEME